MIERREITIPEARSELRKRSLLKNQRGARIHREDLERTFAKTRAIAQDTGLCGRCRHLSVTVSEDPAHRRFNVKNVALHCDAGYNPVNLYLDAELGVVPSCPGFEEK